ncbi:MAG: hypothetical protein OEW00_15155, partial [candidate division Zixibacteria bacterium]|nr:hypothetical protein [candidate division Zixibacteria bacterium]
MTFGRLRFAAGQTIGELAPAENASATIQWYPVYNYPALSLWILFILALIVSPAHREPAAWLILTPAVLIHLIWLLIETLCYFAPSEAQMISQIFVPL